MEVIMWTCQVDPVAYCGYAVLTTDPWHVFFTFLYWVL